MAIHDFSYLYVDVEIGNSGILENEELVFVYRQGYYLVRMNFLHKTRWFRNEDTQIFSLSTDSSNDMQMRILSVKIKS